MDRGIWVIRDDGGVCIDPAVVRIAVVAAGHPPSPGEPVFATHAQADRHAVTLAIAVSEFKFPVFDTGFRHVEGHHPDIVPEVPPTVIFLEEAAGFAHENGEGHVLAVEGFQQGRRRFRSGASTRT